MKERDIKDRIRLALGKDPKVKLFNNPCGVGFVVQGTNCQRITFGLHPGSPDLVGWRTLDLHLRGFGWMVNGVFHPITRPIAQIVGIEVKAPRGELRPEQENFLRQLKAAGGCCGIARSPEEAAKILEDWKFE